MVKLRGLLVPVLLLAAAGPTSAAEDGPDYANQVGYFSAPLPQTSSYAPNPEWTLECDATDSSVAGDYAIVVGHLFADRAIAHFYERPFQHAHYGESVEVAGQDVYREEERAMEPPRRYPTFGGSSSFIWSDLAPSTGYIGFATWGSPASCTGSINGVPRPITTIDGSHAFLAGPEDFGGGVFAQYGHEHVSAGRTFSASLAGGPAVAELWIGDVGEAVLGYDLSDWRPDESRYYLGPDYQECRGPYGGVCSVETDAASRLDGAFLEGWDPHGNQAHLTVVGLPEGSIARPT